WPPARNPQGREHEVLPDPSAVSWESCPSDRRPRSLHGTAVAGRLRSSVPRHGPGRLRDPAPGLQPLPGRLLSSACSIARFQAVPEYDTERHRGAPPAGIVPVEVGVALDLRRWSSTYPRRTIRVTGGVNRGSAIAVRTTEAALPPTRQLG